MGGPRDDAAPLKRGMLRCRCGRRAEISHERLATVATSRVVSVGVLLVLRVAMLFLMALGIVWVGWRSSRDKRYDEEPPPLLCWPDWSYAVCFLYFAMAAAACIRQSNARRCPPQSSLSPSRFAREPTSARSLANTATLFLLEISVVFQTLAVPVTWIVHVREGKRDGRALVSTVALGAVLIDLLLSRSRVEAKHTWILLTFLLAWAAEQVLWVHTGSGHEACYKAFDAERVICLLWAVIAVLVVVALLFAYAALCAQRDRLTSQLESSPDPGYTGPDVEEDVGQEAVETGRISLPAALRPPPASERSSVVNPIFAGSGSRMNRQWPNGNSTCEHRTSLASNDTEMSSGEDLELGWPPEGEPPTANSGGKNSRGSPSVAPMAEGSGRRADNGPAGGALTAHPASWAGYGGAAAWVRSSSRDATPPARGPKTGVRRAPGRF